MPIKIFDYKKVNKSDEFDDIPILDIGPYLSGVPGAGESLAENIRFIADALLPIIPETAEEILRRYGKLILVGDPLFPKKD